MTDRAKNRGPEILTREDVLELLSTKAAAGSVTAMVCLERAAAPSARGRIRR
jgi:hypothetical protein